MGQTPGSNTTDSETFALNAAGEALIPDRVDGTQSNYGLIVQDYDQTDSYQFDSKDKSGGAPPRLTIEYCEPVGIGDRVWDDANGDGIQDGGESGHAGVTVELWQSGGGAADQTTTTDANGDYSFSGVANGNYYVKFILPSGYTFSPKYANSATDPTGSANDSDADISTGQTDVFAYSGTSTEDIDAGIYRQIGDEVWLDSDSDGLQDSGEPSLGGITVRLWNAGADMAIGGGDDSLEQTTVSSAGNSYGFTGVTVNDWYYLQFVLPSSYEFTQKYANGATSPTQNGDDSDADENSGRTDVFQYTGASIDSIDAGLELISFCYGVADNNSDAQPADPNGYVRSAGPDAMYVVDFNTGETIFIGVTNTGSGSTDPGIESIALGLDDTLYAAVDTDSDTTGQLGTLNKVTGAFTPLGSPFDQSMQDPDGFTYDTDNHWLWTSNRRGSGTDEDQLFALYAADCATYHGACTPGQIVPDPFGGGNTDDIVEILRATCPIWGRVPTTISMTSPTIPLAANSTASATTAAATAGTVVKIDITGNDAGNITLRSWRTLPIIDYEGMAFGTDGQLYLSSGWDSRDDNPITSNRLYTMDKSNVASASFVGVMGLDTSCLDSIQRALACQHHRPVKTIGT